MPGDAKTVG